MKWLVTLDQNGDLPAVWKELRSVGGVGNESQLPTPLDDGERVIEVEGPHDLPAKARNLPHVRGIYPNSDLTPY